MRRILLIGGNGQVGWELRRCLAPLGALAVADRQAAAALRLDLADPDTVRQAVRAAAPQVIVNAAAYTAVDRAEQEPALAMAVNGVAPGVLAEEARRLGAVLVHYSTDDVSRGGRPEPCREQDPTGPINEYGRTKLAGEQAVAAVGGACLVFRTSWVYAARGHNFLCTMRRLFAQRDAVRVVDDQIGSPTWAHSIAAATAQVLTQVLAPGSDSAPDLGERAGLYHMSCAGQTSWCGFAREILALGGPAREPSVRVLPIPSTQYPTPARRPAYSMLANARLTEAFGVSLPHWEQALALCLQGEK